MKQDKHRNAVFVVTEEHSCPIYDIDDELRVQDFSLVTSNYKASCLHLARILGDIVTKDKEVSGVQQKTGVQNIRFDCGGCGESRMFFAYKKEKDFATLQMKMLKVSQERRNSAQLKHHFRELRKLDIFKPLNDSSLIDLALLLEFTTIPENKRVVKRGTPGNRLYIVLQGPLAVTNSSHTKIAELKAGEIFGEMSLLTGEPVSNSIHTLEESQLATLSVKHFREILRGYHVLQLFLLKLLVDRSQKVALKSGNITSGMTGNLTDTSTADLFQMISLGRKTGALHFSLPQGKAVVFFREGDVVYARYARHRQKEALSALLDEKSGQFGYTRGIPNDLEKSPPID
jgi:CRP/FNR family cyclic AMP-dependent transcriptional regulator